MNGLALVASCVAGVAPWRLGARLRYTLRSGLVKGADRACWEVSQSSMNEEIGILARQFRKNVMGKGLAGTRTTPTSRKASRMSWALLAEEEKVNRNLKHAIPFDKGSSLLGLLVEKVRPVLAAVVAIVVLVVNDRGHATLRRADSRVEVVVEVLHCRERDATYLALLKVRHEPPTAYHHLSWRTRAAIGEMREKRRRCTAKEIAAGTRVMDEVKAVATPPLNESEFLELVVDLFRN